MTRSNVAIAILCLLPLAAQAAAFHPVPIESARISFGIDQSCTTSPPTITLKQGERRTIDLGCTSVDVFLHGHRVLARQTTPVNVSIGLVEMVFEAPGSDGAPAGVSYIENFSAPGASEHLDEIQGERGGLYASHGIFLRPDRTTFFVLGGDRITVRASGSAGGLCGSSNGWCRKLTWMFELRSPVRSDAGQGPRPSVR